VGIYEINQFCIKNYGKQFEFLDANQIDEILSKLEKDEVKLPSLSSKLFFDLLWKNTEEGFFSDPIYGGNRNKIGWKLLGFPGVSSGAYINHIDIPDLYHAEPVSILDIQQKSADVDAQGYAKHILIKQNKG
jgi:gluconate 2-dehydrogenase gamma chain